MKQICIMQICFIYFLANLPISASILSLFKLQSFQYLIFSAYFSKKVPISPVLCRIIHQPILKSIHCLFVKGVIIIPKHATFFLFTSVWD